MMTLKVNGDEMNGEVGTSRGVHVASVACGDARATGGGSARGRVFHPLCGVTRAAKQR